VPRTVEADDEGKSGRPPRNRIVRITLLESQHIRLSAQVEHERRAALYDLVQESQFTLKDGPAGPYVVHLAIEGESLSFVVNDEHDRPLVRFRLPLADLRRLIKDYFLLCDSYFHAIRTMPPSRIEAIDMGRRGLHNEGAALLLDRLQEFASVDQVTARRLFTLICVLHIRK
jgi:uncharacterized protein (UPF0262 family)